MRKKRNRALILLVLSSVFVVLTYSIFISAQEGSQKAIVQETYISKVLIQASWGEKNLDYDGVASKPGEFGYYVSEETEVAPSNFTVAPNGDIYICDPLNKRIQRFNSSGEFISVIPDVGCRDDFFVDQQGNIYAGRFNNTSYPSVYKFDQSGSLLKTYNLCIKQERGKRPKYHWDGYGHLYCDSKGRLFISYSKYYDKPLFPGDTLSSKTGYFIKFGTTAEQLPLTEQISSLRTNVFLGANSSALDKDQLFQKSFWRSYFLVSSITKDTLKVFTSLQGGLWGMDEDGAIYTFNSLGESRNYIVRKYDQDENLISSFKMSYTRPWVCGEKSAYLDNKGNVYFFIYSGKDGLQIIKWYKK